MKAGTLFGSLVTSTVANAKVKSISAERAEKAYPNDFKLLITHKEIPGANLSSPMDPELPVLAGGEKRVSFYGEPVAFVVATTREIAQFCAEMVNVEYEDVQEAILTIKQAKEKGDTYKMKGFFFLPKSFFFYFFQNHFFLKKKTMNQIKGNNFLKKKSPNKSLTKKIEF